MYVGNDNVFVQQVTYLHHTNTVEILLLSAHEDLLEVSVVVNQSLLEVAEALNHAQLVTNLLLLVGKEGASIAGENVKTSIEVREKRDVAFELGTVMDESATDPLQRCLLDGYVVIELPVMVKINYKKFKSV